MGKLRNVANSIPESKIIVTPLSRILNAMGLRQSHRLTIKEYVEICEEAARDYLGFEPDPRFTELMPRKGERVAAFRISEQTSAASDDFREAAAVLALGVVVALADEELSTDERHEIEAYLAERSSLNDDEYLRLRAWTEWLLASKPRVHSAISSARELFADQSAIDREQVAAIALRVATSDGVVSLSEMETLHRIYSALGLTGDSLQSGISDSDRAVVQRELNGDGHRSVTSEKPPTDQVALLMDVLFN